MKYDAQTSIFSSDDHCDERSGEAILSFIHEEKPEGMANVSGLFEHKDK